MRRGTLALVFLLATGLAAVAQPGDLHHDRKDIRHDRRDLIKTA